MSTQSLTSLAHDQLAAARTSSSGRAAITIYGGREHDMRATMIALAGGAALSEHEAPGEATLQVLEGQVRLVAGAEATEARAGDFVVIPHMRHSLEAVADSVVVLTVATRA